ncbi:MAG TPA: GRP family sugar transporter [Candidatus Aquilonibacter sp.]|nr:GRP family sugar transporter [Candidatus Aquilonibacter sp.]
MAALSPVAAAASSSRSRSLQLLGIFSGLTAGAWLGAAEAPTKLVTLGLSPMVISLVMVAGVFLARWSLPALILGTSSVRADAGRAPHLVLWAILAGFLWAVANTLTVYAIRDIGLSIAFPLWNSNSLLGILWGFLFFNELRGAGLARWLGVLGGTLVMCVGAAILAIASSGVHAAGANPTHGVLAALGAGVLWGTMYIPYRKAYVSGMNPLSFVTFFTIGEVGMMCALSFSTLGAQRLLAQLQSARGVIFWLMLGGFIWVIGDLFQQYAAKYIGISRGIPLSNTNQLWGLLWGVLVFGELHGRSATAHLQVIGGSLLMIAGVGAIIFSSTTARESSQWRVAAQREATRYGLSSDFVAARLDGRQSAGESAPSRTLLDWFLVALATAVFVYFAAIAEIPRIGGDWRPAALIALISLVLLTSCGVHLWRVTRFQ